MIRHITLAILLSGFAITPVVAQPGKDFYGDALPDGAIARLGSVRFHHPKGLTTMAYAPDGKSILAVGGDSMRFWDTDTGKELVRIDAPKDSGFWMRSARLSPDGKYIALIQSQSVELLHSKTGKPARTIRCGQPNHQILSAAFSPDGKLLVTGNMEWLDDNPLRVWNVDTGKEVEPFPGCGSSLHNLTFSSDGKRIFSGPTGGGYSKPNNGGVIRPAICVWDVEGRKKIREIAHHQSNVVFAPTGDLIAMEDDGIRIISVDKGETVCKLPPKAATFVFTADGKALAALDAQRTLALWDTSTGKEIRRFTGYFGHTCRLGSFSPDGKRIAVLDGGWQHDGAIRQWNVETGDEIRVTGGHEDIVTHVAFAPSGKVLASGSKDGSVRLWDAATGKERHQLDGHTTDIAALAFSPDGKVLASSSEDGTVRVWNVADGKLVVKLDQPPGKKLLFNGFGIREQARGALRFDADGKKLTVVCTTGTASIAVYDWAAKHQLREIALERRMSVAVLVPETDAVFSAQGDVVFGEPGSPERLELWQISTGKLYRAMPLRGVSDERSYIIVEALAASADGRLLASSQIRYSEGLRLILNDPVLRIWERASGKEVLTIKGTMGQALAFSPDGKSLVVDDGDQAGWAYRHGTTLSLWDTVTGTRQAKLPGHAAPLHCVAFAPDGKTLATGSADHTVLIWKTPPIKAAVDGAGADDKQLDAWWKSLGDDAAMAHQAAAKLAANTGAAARLIRDRLKPAVPIDAKKIPPLIAALDSGDFETRRDAYQQLEAMGDLAEPALRKAMEKPSSLEAKRRLEALVEKATGMTPEYLHALRALAVLEKIGDAEARKVVAGIAEGAPGTRLTAEAQKVLARMPAK